MWERTCRVSISSVREKSQAVKALSKGVGEGAYADRGRNIVDANESETH